MNNIEAIGQLPKQDDGCVIQSHKCDKPDRDEQKESLEARRSCKQCSTCKMYFCREHMMRPEHFADCHFRLAQEKDEQKKFNKQISEERKVVEENEKTLEALRNGDSDV